MWEGVEGFERERGGLGETWVEGCDVVEDGESAGCRGRGEGCTGVADAGVVLDAVANDDFLEAGGG